jgi:hypothetical protein
MPFWSSGVGWRWAGTLCANPALGGERDELATRRHAASETAVGTGGDVAGGVARMALLGFAALFARPASDCVRKAGLEAAVDESSDPRRMAPWRNSARTSLPLSISPYGARGPPRRRSPRAAGETACWPGCRRPMRMLVPDRGVRPSGKLGPCPARIRQSSPRLAATVTPRLVANIGATYWRFAI